MQVHIHDNNYVPVEQNCMHRFDLEPGKVITLHMHAGECHPCAAGHCHENSINLLLVNGALYVVFEGERVPSMVSSAELRPHHGPIAH